MNQVDHKNLLNAIKSDNLILFDENISSNENVSFGRFPLLSICYLYNAKKIIRKYAISLEKISKFTFIHEDFEIYQEFRKYAGKTLRLYIKDTQVISPIEMLAILNKDRLVKKSYRRLKEQHLISEHIVNNLKTIYGIFEQDIYFVSTSIKINRRPMNSYQKRMHISAMILACSFYIFMLVGVLTFTLTTGLGTIHSTYKIRNEKQLVYALKSNAYCELMSDIQISGNELVFDFNGRLNGKNHNIHVNNYTSTYLIKNNFGHIENINFIYKTIQTETSESISLLAYNNSGTIENIHITADMNLIANKTPSRDIYISSIAIENSKKINSCSTKLKVKIEGKNDGECFVSGICGTNSGEISNCTTNSESSFSTTEADISGICSINEITGKITHSKNYADITHASTQDGWSPNASGIVITNYGMVEKSHNFGSINISSGNNNDNALGTIFLGGISALNYGKHTQCLNYGNLNATSEKLIIYCGGISAYAFYTTYNQGTIFANYENCGTSGTISTTTSSDNSFVFAGGICGYLYGKIFDCYSITIFSEPFNEKKYFLGTCIGASYVQFQVISIEASNNHVLAGENASNHIGALISNGLIIDAGVDISQGIANHMNINNIKSKEIYYEEL